MSIIKSFSVGNGDMFYIKHNSNNFSIIDCCLDDDNKDAILKEIKDKCGTECMRRFISTHPDEDHIKGLKQLCDSFGIWNFYYVDNKATKAEESDSFKYYCKLRDYETNVTPHQIQKGSKWKWMNENGSAEDNKDYGSAGIFIMWPDRSNNEFKKWLKSANEGSSYNNISPIIKYAAHNGAVALWMGDMSSDYIAKIAGCIDWPKVDILFAPHHGRATAKISELIMKKMAPKVVVIGEGPSADLDYYTEWNTLTQNTAKNLTFVCRDGIVDVYSSCRSYSAEFLTQNSSYPDCADKYIGSFFTHNHKDRDGL